MIKTLSKAKQSTSGKHDQRVHGAVTVQKLL